MAPFRSKRVSRSARFRQRYIPPAKRAALSKSYRYVRGVYNGNYYRVRVANQNYRDDSSFRVPKLVSHPMPKAFKAVPPVAVAEVEVAATQAAASSATTTGALPGTTKAGGPVVGAAQQQQQQQQQQKARQQARQDAFRARILEWWRQNWPILVLNAGSLCTLAGFTRSDVLELRTLSTMGSLSFIAYACWVAPERWIPIAWSTVFASVNIYKIAQILTERTGHVILTDQQQEVYEEFFLPHGTTLKQFELIWKSGKIIKVKKGSILIRKGEPIHSVWLVLEGATRATALGRHLTAASSSPTKRKKHGGDSGAWIGEMVFLQTFDGNGITSASTTATGTNLLENTGSNGKAGIMEPFVPFEVRQKNKQGALSTRSSKDGYVPPQDGSNNDKDSGTRKDHIDEMNNNMQTQNGFKNEAFFTTMAIEDSVLLEWTHEEMADLMKRSDDMRSTLTRAMTAAVVGKVINFTVSRSKFTDKWTSWLGNWQQQSVTTAIRQENKHPIGWKRRDKTDKDARDGQGNETDNEEEEEEDDDEDEEAAGGFGNASSPLHRLSRG